MIINDNDVKIKVVATDQFKRCRKKPMELDHIPEPGEVFECTYNRARYLGGANAFKRAFVKIPRKDGQGITVISGPHQVVQVNPVYSEDLSADDISFDALPVVLPVVEEQPIVVNQAIEVPEVEVPEEVSEVEIDSEVIQEQLEESFTEQTTSELIIQPKKRGRKKHVDGSEG